jgi:hypothetical protein
VRLRRLAELVGLNGIIVAEPVLTALRDGADVFVTRRAEGWHIVVLTLAIVVGVPLVLLVLEELAFRRRLLGDAGLPGWVVVGLALVGGLGLLVAVTRWDGVRQWLQLLGLFPLVLAGWFLLTDPVRGLLVGDSAGDARPVDRPAPVVLVVLDEFPEASLLDAGDRIDAAQFPNLASLAEDATWFRNTTGVSPTTPEAVPPILTGSYNDGVGLLPTIEEHPDNLFTLLRGEYRLHVKESVTSLCPCGAGALATG